MKRCFFTLWVNLILFGFTSTPSWAVVAPLAWDPVTTNYDGTPANDVAGYKIYRATSTCANFAPAVDATPLATVDRATTYSDATATDLTDYCYRVRSFDTSGNLSDLSLSAAFYNHAPAVSFSVNNRIGASPLAVQFNCSGSDQDANSLTYALDFDGDGNPEITQSSPIVANHTYNASANAKCTVTDSRMSAVTDIIAIYINGVPPPASIPPAPNVSLSVSGSGSVANFVCNGTDPSGVYTTFIGSMKYGDGVNYAWPPRHPPILQTHQYTQPGRYMAQCSLRVNNVGSLGSATIGVLVASDGNVRAMTDAEMADWTSAKTDSLNSDASVQSGCGQSSTLSFITFMITILGLALGRKRYA